MTIAMHRIYWWNLGPGTANDYVDRLLQLQCFVDSTLEAMVR